MQSMTERRFQKMHSDLMQEKHAIVAELNKRGCGNRRAYYEMTAKQRRQRGITSDIRKLYKRLQEIQRELATVEKFLQDADIMY